MNGWGFTFFLYGISPWERGKMRGCLLSFRNILIFFSNRGIRQEKKEKKKIYATRDSLASPLSIFF